MSKEKTRILIYDRASIESSQRSIDENGYLHVAISNVTKEQVAPYYGDEIPNFKQLGFKPDELYHGYRPASELSKEETVKSLNGIPILLEHHPDSAESPAKEYRVGATGTDAQFNAPYLQNSLHIQDADAISRIKDGSMQELSLGYFYTPIRKEGEFNGEKYDFIMTDIACNHVALVERGRAGSDVCVEDSELRKHLPSHDAGDGKEDNLPTGEGASMEEKETLLNEFLKELADAGIDAEKAKGKLNQIFGTEAEKEDLTETEEIEKVEEVGTADECDNAEDEGKEVEAEKGEDEELESEAETEEKEEVKTFDAEEVLKSCGLDAEDPIVKTAFQKGFAEGTKYGEKLEKKEPEKLDSEHESEGEKRALGEDSVRRLVKAVEDKFNAKFNAIEETKASLGKVRASAFDSADDVYISALKAEGVNVKGFKKSEARTAYRALMAGKAKAVRTTASDSIKKVSKSNTSNILAGVRMGEF